MWHRMEEYRPKWRDCTQFNREILQAHSDGTGGWRFDRGEYIQNLIDTAEVLDRHNISFWAAFGTLLGLVRGDSPIEGDHDSDIAVHEDDEEKIVDLYLNPRPFELKGLLLGRASCDMMSLVRWDKEHKFCSYIDIYFFRRKIPNWLMCSCYSIDEWRIENMWQMRKHGRVWNIPAQPESYLTETYGPDWKTPKPNAWAIK